MKEKRRLTAIDATRGTAMLFVCVSHMHYYVQSSAPALSDLLLWFGYIATPTFLLLSGLIASHQLTSMPTRATALRILDRGLFVILVGHVLVLLSELYMVTKWSELLRYWVITDTIGLFLCGTWLFRALLPRQLLASGVALLLLSWTMVVVWQPESLFGRAVGLFLLGIKFEGSRDLGLATPLIPYLGIFLIGMYAGKFVTGRLAEGRTEDISRMLSRAGATGIGAAVAGFMLEHFIRHILQRHSVDAGVIETVREMFDPRQKVPPSPGYVLFYGGVGLSLVGILMNERIRVLLSRPVSAVAVIGRASFVAFIAQQWIISFIPRWTGLDAYLSPKAALVYLAASMVAVVLIATAWDRIGGNRYLTVGLKPARKTFVTNANLA